MPIDLLFCTVSVDIQPGRPDARPQNREKISKIGKIGKFSAKNRKKNREA
jgi:hypothetical protein